MVRRFVVSILAPLVVAAVALVLEAALPATVEAQQPPAQAPTAAPAAEPGMVAQHANFLIFLRGNRVGIEEIEVLRTDTEWILKGAGRLEPPLNITLREAETRYGLDLKPRSLRLVGQVRDQPINITTTFEGTTAKNVYAEAGEFKELSAAVSEDTLILPNNYFGGFVALGARVARSTAGARVHVFVPPQHEIVAVLDEVVTEHVQTASRSFAVRRHRMTFQNPGAPLQVDVETEENGALVRITVPAGELQVVREDVASVAARQQKVVRPGDEDVRIPANGFHLAATFSKPTRGDTPAKRAKPTPVPAIILVAGSGPVDRDETVFGIPIFGQLATSLADAGYAVVRYDKRGVGQSGGRTEAATLNDYAEDLLAVVRWLRKRDDVDERRVSVVGHSEGGWVALLAAAREDGISRVVAVAAPGTTGAELVLEQQRHALAGMELSEEERQKRVDLQKKIQAALIGGGTWEGIPDEYRKQADTPWFASLLSFDPPKVMPRVKQPLLIIAAELDRQVPVHHAEKLAALARARKKGPGVQVATLPGINHLLVPAKTGEVSEYASLPEKAIDPAVARTITTWLATAPATR